MEKEAGMLAIGGICLLVLCMSVLKKRAEILLRVMVRGALCMGCLYGGNQLFYQYAIPIQAGFNWCTLGITSILGIGGVLLIYGILLVKLL